MPNLELFQPRDEIYTVGVPASKSMLNRALLLAAFGGVHEVTCHGGYGSDTKSLLACLRALGFSIEEEGDILRVGGTPARQATLNVGDSATTARFLTAILAFRGGDFTFVPSPQMAARPMPSIDAFRAVGVRFDRLQGGAFRMRSGGIAQNFLEIDTSVTTQDASGVLLAAALGKKFTLILTGRRENGSYLRMTAAMLRAFGATVGQHGNEITVTAGDPPSRLETEPDVSAACYFYALALLCRAAILVRGVHFGGLQGDLAFLDLLAAKGLILTDTPNGILADGRKARSFDGFNADFGDFSDQTLTAAAIAPFAASPSVLRGVGHIRKQECDRMEAIRTNLETLGVPVRLCGDNVEIAPAPVRGGTVRTFGDHRVAMAFALAALKSGNITIDDPDCCRKTFPNYFEILRGLCLS